MNSSFSRFLKSLGIGDLCSVLAMVGGKEDGDAPWLLKGTDTVFFQDLRVAAVRDAAEDRGRGETS